ncbi:hypothetical protein BDV06DRAFT_235790 [Aspergillus oleicola]
MALCLPRSRWDLAAWDLATQTASSSKHGQGLIVGSLLAMAAITIANMKRHILLHKLIFAENRPFLSRKVSLIYIVSKIYANLAYFNNINKVSERTRHLEPLFRPRFGIMLGVMCLSLAFVVVDACGVLGLSFFSSFKCLCDTVIMDGVKTALDRMRGYWFAKQMRTRSGDLQEPLRAGSGPGQYQPMYRERAGGGDVEMDMLSTCGRQESENGKGTSNPFPRGYMREDIRFNA